MPDGFSHTSETTNFGQIVAKGPDDRLVYQGHPPNDNNWYSYDEFNPPTESPNAVSLNLSKSGARTRLRTALGTSGTVLIAHHLIPLGMRDLHPDLLLKAARGGFDINAASSGIALARADHVGGHPVYNEAVQAELAQINVNLPAKEIAAQVQAIADRLRGTIVRGTFGPWVRPSDFED